MLLKNKCQRRNKKGDKNYLETNENVNKHTKTKGMQHKALPKGSSLW